MSGTSYDGTEQTETVLLGSPMFPAVVTIPVGGTQHPFYHGTEIVVGKDPDLGGVYFGITHKEAPHGYFMGWHPDFARSVASWLIREANEIDGGSGKQ